jgi:serine phosphatase RsbU (regulator of sigma subunit)
VRSSGVVDTLGPTGVPVGLIQGASYEESELTLEPGDLLLLYTDGITEAENPEAEEFGLERLVDFCQAHRRDETEAFAAELEGCLNRFTQGQPAADDRTIVVVRRLES